MAIERPGRRLTLRDIMIDAEKRTRDLTEKVGKRLLNLVSDLRELSRPMRKRSPYPSLVALHNSLAKALEGHAETSEMIDYLTHELDEIREHARRERVNRGG